MTLRNLIARLLEIDANLEDEVIIEEDYYPNSTVNITSVLKSGPYIYLSGNEEFKK